MKKYLFLIALTMIQMTAAHARTAKSPIEARIAALEAKVAALEGESLSQLRSSAYCSALCGGYKYDYATLNSKPKGDSVSGAGATVEEAFQHMRSNCDEFLFIGTEHSGLLLATPANSCK